MREPRIAVLSLNPHAGDGGLIGSEEKEIIVPAIQAASQQKILAFGPFAADGFFASAGYMKYDAVLAMYHDQGLAPFKALSCGGVNFTAGLPVVRTSPAHGVGFDAAAYTRRLRRTRCRNTNGTAAPTCRHPSCPMNRKKHNEYQPAQLVLRRINE